jgi:CheY-like chemotaxis protein
VLINLVVNAQQALAGCADPRRLSVRARSLSPLREVEIAVADNGPGVPAELRGRVFDPYFTTKPAGEGTGLGLAMSLNHIRSHDGRLTIEATPGGGATFVIRLPVIEPPPEAAAPPPAVGAAPSGQRRVLVVDDEPEIADLLEDILAADGNQIVVEPDGDAALARLVAEPFDLVVSDLTMPGLDGAGLWREARARLAGQAPPFVFLTGDSLRLDRASEMREAGCPFIEKPFEPAAIRRVIREALSRTG